jgi:NAD+ diphosphatase
VDRAAHRRTDRRWLDAAWQRARVLLIDSTGRSLCILPRPDAPGQVRAGGGAPFQDVAEPEVVFLDPADAPDGDRMFLGVDAEDTPYFAVVADLPPLDGATPVTLREVGAVLGDRDAGLFVTAAALARWHAAHRYAPATGEPTRMADGGWLRVDSTGTQLFPRTDPAVIVLVQDGVPGPEGRCLLGHNTAWRGRTGGRRFYSTLAGFVEPGESAEAAVVGEVREEVGVEVAELTYVGSQAWPFPASLMLGFTGLADPALPLCPDGAEIAEARWFSRAEIAALLADPVATPAGTPPRSGAATGPGPGRASAAPAAPEVTLPGPASIAHHLIGGWCHRPARDEGDGARR